MSKISSPVGLWSLDLTLANSWVPAEALGFPSKHEYSDQERFPLGDFQSKLCKVDLEQIWH